jgi:hypothetical protein
MENEIQIAADKLRDDAKEYVTYFVPEGEVHFDPVSVISGFAAGLVISFLAGFEREARKAATKAGKSTFQWLIQLFTDRSKEKEQLEVAKKQVMEAKKSKKSAKEADIDIALERAEESLREELAPKLGKRKAAALAKKVREVATSEILSRD